VESAFTSGWVFMVDISIKFILPFYYPKSKEVIQLADEEEKVEEEVKEEAEGETVDGEGKEETKEEE